MNRELVRALIVLAIALAIALLADLAVWLGDMRFPL